MRGFACDIYRDEKVFQTSGVLGSRLGEPLALAYALPSEGPSTELDDEGHIFPQDVPLELGGRRVDSVLLNPTDVAIGLVSDPH